MIERQPHNPAKVCTKYTALDIETRADGSVIAVGLAYWHGDARRYKQFDGWDDALRFILDNAKKLKGLRKIYAHNGVSFDWLSLMESAQFSELVKLERARIVQSGGFGIGIDVKLTGNKGTIRLRDSLRILPASLKKLTRRIDTGYKKLDLDADMLPEELYGYDRAMFDEYLRLDCFALQDVLEETHKIINEHIGIVETLPMTTAGLSLMLWRDYYMESPMMTTWGKDLAALERKSYVGARNEVINYGVFDNVFIYDVNSEYPAVMLDKLFPISYHGYWTKEFIPGALGIYEIIFEQTNIAEHPLLLVDNVPAYAGHGTYCSPEIEKLLELGGVITVDNGYVYANTGNPFKRFVQTLYEMRRNAADEGLAYLCKLIMNGLTGKFAQKEESEVFVYLSADEQSQMVARGESIVSYGEWCIVKETAHVEHAFTALSSFITCYGRLKLYEYMQHSGANVVYVDTDSVHVTAPIAPEYVGDDIGQMKLEYAGRAAYAGKKLYALQDKIRAKGIIVGGRNGDARLDFDTIARLATGKQKTFRATFSTPTTLREMIFMQKPACVWHKRTRIIQRS